MRNNEKSWEMISDAHVSRNKLLIASSDYIDPETKKSYFSWNEAMELETTGGFPLGWRLPTMAEWNVIGQEFGLRTKDRRKDSRELVENIGLTYSGLINFGDLESYNHNPEEYEQFLVDRHGSGYYWSSTADIHSRAYCFRLDNFRYFRYNFRVISTYRIYGLRIRLVAEIL